MGDEEETKTISVTVPIGVYFEMNALMTTKKCMTWLELFEKILAENKQ